MPSRFTDSEQFYYIGQVADLTGASRKAIRLYEEQGLLPPPARRGTYRIYSDKELFMVHVIKHAQSYGFNLTELRELIAAIGREQHFPLNAALSMVEKKREAVLTEAEALKQLHGRLGELMDDMKKNFV